MKERSGERRRTHTQRQIDALLAEREAMLLLLWKISGRGDALPHAPEPDTLAEFVAVLVDYLAAAHFGLYRRLAEGSERRAAVLATAAEVYDRISETTDEALAFNDRYGGRTDAHLDRRLPEDIARLAEIVAERIRLEDRLLEAMRES